MTEAIFRKRTARLAGEIGLFPADDEGRELLRSLRMDRDAKAAITTPRNSRQHRLFFAMCKFVKTHCELWSDASIDKIRIALKLGTGHYELWVDTETLSTVYIPMSMSFASMDQTAFNKFFANAVEVICRRWMPIGTLSADVERELLSMVDGPYERREMK